LQKTILSIYQFLNRHKLIYVLIVLLISGHFASSAFFTPFNLLSLMRLSSIMAFLVLGEALVILTKGIDLSVGWVASLSTVVIAAVNQSFNGALSPIPLAILAIFCALALGSFLGFINGISVAILQINPLIVTLAGMWIAQGMAMYILRGIPVRITITEFTNLGQMKILKYIPVIMIILIAFALFLFFILNKNRFGRYLYALGGNEYAAYLSGININTIKIIVYSLSGFLASFGGMMMATWTKTGDEAAMAGYELTTICAVVMGGIALTGGEGNILDAVLGSYILIILRKLLIYTGINPWLFDFFVGLILLGSVYFIQGRKKSIR